MLEFARIWLDMPKFVFSRTGGSTDWNTTVVREVDPEEIRRLQAEPGGDMVVAGADLADTFRRLDLIDEYRLYVNPILLGSGTPMFRPADTPGGAPDHGDPDLRQRRGPAPLRARGTGRRLTGAGVSTAGCAGSPTCRSARRRG